jgi:hypothetical protein
VPGTKRERSRLGEGEANSERVSVRGVKQKEGGALLVHGGNGSRQRFEGTVHSRKSVFQSNDELGEPFVC